MNDLKIYVGYDPREDIAYRVCEHSLTFRSPDAKVIPIKKYQLIADKIYTRPDDAMSSTEFTFTRFLVPYLQNYKGWALFIDCDTIAQENIKHLFALADKKYAVMCVQHNYVPSTKTKMDNQKQFLYPRKNWSSVMLINCAHKKNKILTPEFISDEETTGSYLHRFSWLENSDIGSLPVDYNWLSGWYREPADGSPKLIHYTEGGPWFSNYFNTAYHERWKREYRYLTGKQFTKNDVIDK